MVRRGLEGGWGLTSFTAHVFTDRPSTERKWESTKQVLNSTSIDCNLKDNIEIDFVTDIRL